jgi:capsular polysaccharide biosynthesis protein
MAAQDSVEALQLLIADKDNTITVLKDRTKLYVEKMKADHAQALEQEILLRQQAQVMYRSIVKSYWI